MCPILVHKEPIELDEPLCEVGLQCTWVDPCIPSLVTYQCTKIPPLPQGCCLHRSTYIGVKASQAFPSSIMPFLEWGSGHFPMHTCFTIEVLRVIWDIIQANS